MMQYPVQGKATIEDVASRCGFSRATVSRVITKEGSVRPATNAKVRRAIEELGQAPNSMAQALSGGKTRTLAVVLPDVLRQYYSYLLAGADAVAEEKGYHLLIKTGDCRKAFLDLIEQRRVDGFIIRNAGEPALDGRTLARLARHGLPCLFIGRPPDGSAMPSIQIDNVGGARAMARHDAEQGVRIPEDLALTGFDDSLFADCLWPPLTTVRQPMYEIGASAVQTLVGWLEGSPARQVRTILPTQLVIRRSCGCTMEYPGSTRHEQKNQEEALA